MSKPLYSERIDAVIYSSPASGFTSNDWVELAKAALDQAGLRLASLQRIEELIREEAQASKVYLPEIGTSVEIDRAMREERTRDIQRGMGEATLPPHWENRA